MTRATTILALTLAFGTVLSACGEPADAPVEDEIQDGLRLLSPRRQLIRLSVDLRGAHPSAD